MKIHHLKTSKLFITVCNFTVAIICLIMMIVRMNSSDPIIAKTGIALCLLMSSISVALVFFKKNYQFGAISIFVIAAILHPIRVYYTGGVYSFGFIWFVPLILAVFWTSGVRYAVGAAIFQTIAVSIMLMTLDMPRDFDFYASTHFARSLTMLFAPIISAVLFSFFAGHEQKKYLELTKKTEKDTLDTLGITMAHEINSPLMALMGSMDKVEKKYNLNQQDKETIDKAINEIRTRLDQIERLGKEQIQKEKYTSQSKTDIFVIDKNKNNLN